MHATPKSTVPYHTAPYRTARQCCEHGTRRSLPQTFFCRDLIDGWFHSFLRSFVRGCGATVRGTRTRTVVALLGWLGTVRAVVLVPYGVPTSFEVPTLEFQTSHTHNLRNELRIVSHRILPTRSCTRTRTVPGNNTYTAFYPNLCYYSTSTSTSTSSKGGIDGTRTSTRALNHKNSVSNGKCHLRRSIEPPSLILALQFRVICRCYPNDRLLLLLLFVLL
mmetsp:Transcript_2380/g.4304  ORF Transcript_2380/g.4304 Transcript_2380/m.4304 type:complete len:220 (+) Transcript_2380:296-955(+)